MFCNQCFIVVLSMVEVIREIKKIIYSCGKVLGHSQISVPVVSDRKLRSWVQHGPLQCALVKLGLSDHLIELW